jgi:hypothetical protein
MSEQDIRAGSRYRAREDLPVLYLTHWSAAFTGGGEGILPAGTAFKVALDPPTTATAASCDPEDYAALELLLVPEQIRDATNYSNFSLVIDLAAIRNRCDRVSG